MNQRAIQTSLGALAVVAIGLGVVEFILYKRDALAYPRAITIIAIRPTGNANAPCEVVNDGFASRMFAKPGDRLTWLVVGECKNLSISIKNLFHPGATEATANATSGAVMMVEAPSNAQLAEYGYDITFGPRFLHLLRQVMGMLSHSPLESPQRQRERSSSQLPNPNLTLPVPSSSCARIGRVLIDAALYPPRP